MSIVPNAPRQRGVALVVALTLLLFASIIALSAVRYSALTMRVSNNTEHRISTFQNVQSVIDATVADPANTPVNLTSGYIACSTGVTGCNAGASTVTLQDNFLASDLAAQRVKIKVRRVPAVATCPRAFGNELDFSCAQFVIEASYDNNATGRGRSFVNEGLIVPYN